MILVSQHHMHSHFHLLLHATHVTKVVMGSSADLVCNCCRARGATAETTASATFSTQHALDGSKNKSTVRMSHMMQYVLPYNCMIDAGRLLLCTAKHGIPSYSHNKCISSACSVHTCSPQAAQGSTSCNMPQQGLSTYLGQGHQYKKCYDSTQLDGTTGMRLIMAKGTIRKSIANNGVVVYTKVPFPPLPRHTHTQQTLCPHNSTRPACRVTKHKLWPINSDLC